MLKEGEKTEPLGSGRSVIVSSEHSFGTDTVLLADFAQSSAGRSGVDLGCASGALMKDISNDDFLNALHAVVRGEKIFDHARGNIRFRAQLCDPPRIHSGIFSDIQMRIIGDNGKIPDLKPRRGAYDLLHAVRNLEGIVFHIPLKAVIINLRHFIRGGENRNRRTLPDFQKCLAA